MRPLSDVPEPTPEQVGAYDAGIIAYNEGRPSTSVPFLNADPDVADLRILWIRGWVHARTAHRYGNYPELSDPAVIRLLQREPRPTVIQVAAFDAGAIAYNTGQPSTACPFRNDSLDDVGDLRILWIRGWVLARNAHLYGDVELPPTDPKLRAMECWRIGRAP